jgi:hypothetical protein
MMHPADAELKLAPARQSLRLPKFDSDCIADPAPALALDS